MAFGPQGLELQASTFALEAAHDAHKLVMAVIPEIPPYGEYRPHPEPWVCPGYGIEGDHGCCFEGLRETTLSLPPLETMGAAMG